SGTRVGVRRCHERNAVDCDWPGHRRWTDLVVASRLKDTASAGGGSDAVANSELLVEGRRFFSEYPHKFPFCGRFGPIWPDVLVPWPMPHGTHLIAEIRNPPRRRRHT